MQMKSLAMGMMLVAGLLAGCGGTAGELEPVSAPTGDEQSEVGATALCSDCDWLFVRCMSRATTAEQEQNCEGAREDCRATWCTAAAPVQAQDVTACMRACANAFRVCTFNAPTPEDGEACAAELHECRYGPYGCSPIGG
jgi:hypothetical protein